LDTLEIATNNLAKCIINNSYPGRGLVVAKAEDDCHWLLIYWIMGRSDISRNRRFVTDAKAIRTIQIVPTDTADKELLVYDAMVELPDIYIIGNGNHTKTIYDRMNSGFSFKDALEPCEREPDSPNYTPRISAMLKLKNLASVEISILKANKVDPKYTDRHFYVYDYIKAGYGVGISTYAGDENPLPSFKGDPLLLPCQGTAEDVLEEYWKCLNSRNKVAIAVKEISMDQTNSKVLIRNNY
jgi:IMP cyclohydrolase